ncbi:MAG: hypothetical protein ABI723_22235 [Bacteroidia bacterium]
MKIIKKYNVIKTTSDISLLNMKLFVLIILSFISCQQVFSQPHGWPYKDSSGIKEYYSYNLSSKQFKVWRPLRKESIVAPPVIDTVIKDLGNIEYLEIDSIGNSIDIDLRKFKNLRILSLGSIWAKLPSSVRFLKKLEVVKIGSNLIIDPFPKEFYELHRLKEISFIGEQPTYTLLNERMLCFPLMKHLDIIIIYTPISLFLNQNISHLEFNLDFKNSPFTGRDYSFYGCDLNFLADSLYCSAIEKYYNSIKPESYLFNDIARQMGGGFSIEDYFDCPTKINYLYDAQKNKVDSAFFLKLRSNKHIKLFYDNGKLAAVGNFKKGVPDGNWYFFSEKGDTLSTRSYDYGLAVGIWVSKYDNGKIRTICDFGNGRFKKYMIYSYCGYKTFEKSYSSEFSNSCLNQAWYQEKENEWIYVRQNYDGEEKFKQGETGFINVTKE